MLQRSPILALVALLAAAVLPPREAMAADGVIELNQARALAGGVTPGDAAGFPVTISQSGSYRLTSDLDLTGGGGGIEVVAPARDVSIDLGGFAIRGVGVCTVSAGGVDCTFLGLPNGVTSTAATARITLRNGTIRGMRSGVVISVAESVVIEGLESTNHTNTGIFVGSGIPAVVRRSETSVIAGRGIDVGALGHVVDCIVSSSGDNGIMAADISGSSASGNFGLGIDANFSGASVRGSRAVGSGGTGIRVGAGGLVSDSTAQGNKVGVQLGAGASLLSSTSSGNSGVGLFTVAGSTYAGNTLTGNNGGLEVQVSGAGTELDRNFCGTDTTCP